MAQFASLPNELIREILQLVQPEDFENLAQVSRNVYSLASPFLKQHRALIRKYHTLSNDAGPSAVATLLRTVIADPRIGSYVREVELDEELEFSDESDEEDLYTEEELETFTKAALDSKCLKRPSEGGVLDEREFWADQIKDGDEDILLAILLPLLPNLAALSLGNKIKQLQWSDSTVESAASATKPTLCKLTRICLTTASHLYGHSLTKIQKFCALPSVRVLTAPGAYGVDCLPNISLDIKSNVTDLNLWESCIDSKVLYEFLSSFERLQSFTYSSTCASNGVPHDSFLVRSSLLVHCKATLRSLTLLDPGLTEPSFMGSLRAFEVLEEVYTEWSFLLLKNSTEVPRLNEHLPASLVRLKIHDSMSYGKILYEGVIRSALHASQHRLQSLKELGFGGSLVGYSLETIDQYLRKRCLDMGITLNFSPHDPRMGTTNVLARENRESNWPGDW